MAARFTASFHEKWVWASHMPGIRVAPAPSMTMALPGAIGAVLRPTWRMRLPCTRTLPL